MGGCGPESGGKKVRASRAYGRDPDCPLCPLEHPVSLSKHRAFIPTLSWLRDMDNQEGILGVPTPPRIQEFLNSLFEQFGDLYPFLGVSPEERKAIHINHWTYEQWRRRAIWCWNLDEGE